MLYIIPKTKEILSNDHDKIWTIFIPLLISFSILNHIKTVLTISVCNFCYFLMFNVCLEHNFVLTVLHKGNILQNQLYHVKY